MAQADFLTGLLSGLGGSVTEQLKAKQESRQKTSELEQQERIKAKYRQPDAASQRLQLVLQAIGMMGEPTPKAPQPPVPPVVSQPSRPLGPRGTMADVGVTRQETLQRILERAQTTPNRQPFFQRGSVNRLLGTLGLSPQGTQQFAEEEATFPTRQQGFEQSMAKRRQAQLVLEALGYRGLQDQDDPIVQTATDAETGERGAITQSGQVIPLQ